MIADTTTSAIHDALASSDMMQASSRRLEAIERTLSANTATISELNKKIDNLARLVTTLTETCAHEAAGRAKPRAAAAKKPASDGKQPFVEDSVDEDGVPKPAPPKSASAKSSRGKPTVLDIAIAAFVSAIGDSTVTETAVATWRGDTKPGRGPAGIKKMLTDYAATLPENLQDAARTYIAGL